MEGTVKGRIREVIRYHLNTCIQRTEIQGHPLTSQENPVPRHRKNFSKNSPIFEVKQIPLYSDRAVEQICGAKM